MRVFAASFLGGWIQSEVEMVTGVAHAVKLH